MTAQIDWTNYLAKIQTMALLSTAKVDWSKSRVSDLLAAMSARGDCR